MARARDGSEPARRPLGRRKRRLYWTIGLLLLAAAGGGAVTLAVYFSTRPATYRPGEDHAEITRRLRAGVPDDAPDPRLTDVTAAAGLGDFRTFVGARTSQLPEDMGSGAAWGDYDGDGDDDLLVVAAGGPLGSAEHLRAPTMLYRNLGDGTFAPDLDFPDTRIHGMGAAWGDYSGDGRIDLVVTGYGTLRLFRNTGGRLERDPAIDDREGFWAGASWSDFDGDGDLDLYVCGYVRYVPDDAGAARSSRQYGRDVPYTLNPASFPPQRNLLFRNRGDGTFDEVAETLGVHNPQGRSLGALWHDLDEDGWPDLYVANDISDNALYLNRGGRFEEASHAAWVADYRGAMGLAAGDWNRDGDDDIFVTHWVAQENALYDSLLRDLADTDEPALRFMDVADQRGLGQIALQLVGWGAAFADLDGDGWLDLAVANGSTFETDDTPPRLRAQPAFLFWNRRGSRFHDLAPSVPALAAPRVGRGLALSDYDDDGDVDILLVDLDAGVLLLRNDMQSGHWIEVRLAGAPVEGALVTVRIPDATLRRRVGGVSYLSQDSRTLHFGLGATTRADAVEIVWPGGRRDVHENLLADRIWDFVPGQATPRESRASAAPAIGRTRDVFNRQSEFWSKQRAAMHAMKVDGDLQRAIALFREALALNPTHEDSLYYLGNCLAETEQLADALATFDQLRENNPMSHRAHVRAGVLRAQTARSAADLDLARAALERAVSINPEETGASLALAELALLQGEHVEARERLAWVARSNPQSASAFLWLAYLEWESGDLEQSKTRLQQARQASSADRTPEGAVAEGDVRRKMHVESTPLSRFSGRWDGSLDAEAVFSSWRAELRSLAAARDAAR